LFLRIDTIISLIVGPLMYYSYLSTGNAKIDSEHTNIDSMVDLCRNQEREWVSSARSLISAMVNHLDSEEKICMQAGLNMTQEHLAEHLLLKSRLAHIEKQVGRGELDKDVFLLSFRDMLFFHISNFDKHLNDG
jgi:hemerythrin-like metal-binding protein